MNISHDNVCSFHSTMSSMCQKELTEARAEAVDLNSRATVANQRLRKAEAELCIPATATHQRRRKIHITFIYVLKNSYIVIVKEVELVLD